MIDHKDSELDQICKSILDHPNFCSTTSFDLYTIFRHITSKKFGTKYKSYLKFPELDVACVQKSKDLSDLISRINPFYKFDNEEKNSYYVLHYLFAKQICQRINQISKERHLPKYFVILDCDTKNYITNDEIEIGGNMREAIFLDKQEVFSMASKYLQIYEFTQIPKSVEIHGINMDKQIVYTLKLSSGVDHHHVPEEFES